MRKARPSARPPTAKTDLTRRSDTVTVTLRAEVAAGPSSERVNFCARVRMLEHTRLLTADEVALKLRQSPRTIRDKIASGELPALRVGSGPRAPLRSDPDELAAWLYGTPRPRPTEGETCRD